ncbi:Pyridoxamine 5'-phosphate oxidase [Prauserella flava]|nr:Pyridoxamine 5'-phosphate oxidase [Prauserella flava]MCR3737241.1 Pyridoxamine 5'-phosphate oxidase [Prauserella salsuginis]
MPNFDIHSFLDEPGRPAAVSTVTERGRPALATMWFLFADGCLWFHSPVDKPAPFLAAAAAGREVSVLIATFSPPHDVRQFRATGPAALASRDLTRVHRIYERYVPAWSAFWREHATSDRLRLWSMLPERGMAVAYPGLAEAPVYRWSEPTWLDSAESAAGG